MKSILPAVKFIFFIIVIFCLYLAFLFKPNPSNINNTINDSISNNTDNVCKESDSMPDYLDYQINIIDLNGKSKQAYISKLMSEYKEVGYWNIVDGFGKGEVGLYKNGTVYLLIDYEASYCYEMKKYEIQRDNEFVCYALNKVNDYFYVNKGQEIYINSNIGEAYDNDGSMYNYKMILIVKDGYSGVLMNDNATRMGKNVYVEHIRLEQFKN